MFIQAAGFPRAHQANVWASLALTPFDLIGNINSGESVLEHLLLY